jgi:hypothetical protein
VVENLTIALQASKYEPMGSRAFVGDRRIAYRGNGGELALVLQNVQERGFCAMKLGRELGYHPRSVHKWRERGVPRYILALALALIHLEPEQLAQWRADFRTLRS